ncbi:MAG: hypothetical protein DI569_12980 [Sphingopyxis macrogoltabida]|uniref:Uncharacterized protein n=1 Tax=Sphingopyxis macrogoltabida TaxID=33050 RepID=A0A2W5KVY3_SPHMC|nr:MAG: hypothetical protein DI569_12980 [Sphingopyxis macrogoltabida]
MKKATIILVVTSAVMIAGTMATADDLAEVSPAEAENFTARGKARLAVPGVDYDPAEYPNAENDEFAALAAADDEGAADGASIGDDADSEDTTAADDE